MKTPSYQFYPGDWKRDTALQACEFDSRAIWREMIDAMHDGEPYGHLTAGGAPITAEQFARMIGVHPKRVRGAWKELESRQVFSRTPGGVIYSRRMVRDSSQYAGWIEKSRLGGQRSAEKRATKPPTNPPSKEQPPMQPNGQPSGEPPDQPNGKQGVNQKATLQSAVCITDISNSNELDGEVSKNGKHRRAPKKTGRPTWLTPFSDGWSAATGGVPNFGAMARHLRPIFEQFGETDSLRGWLYYLRKTEPQFASASAFAERAGHWIKQSQPIMGGYS